jgi:hypothetical protein
MTPCVVAKLVFTLYANWFTTNSTPIGRQATTHVHATAAGVPPKGCVSTKWCMRHPSSAAPTPQAYLKRKSKRDHTNTITYNCSAEVRQLLKRAHTCTHHKQHPQLPASSNYPTHAQLLSRHHQCTLNAFGMPVYSALRWPKSYHAAGRPSWLLRKPWGGFWPGVGFFQDGTRAHFWGLCQQGTSRHSVAITPHFVSLSFSKAPGREDWERQEGEQQNTEMLGSVDWVGESQV